MWKTGLLLTAPTVFFPQGPCEIFTDLHDRLWKEIFRQDLHRKDLHIPQRLWKDTRYEI